jgi:hypothetical protein
VGVRSYALLSIRLYKSPNVAAAKPIVLLLAECALNCGAAWQEDYIMSSLWDFAGDIPAVEAILTRLPPPPERVAKDRHCAHPDCDTLGSGLYNNMKKCGRCLAVYYCCIKHQHEHWLEHRLTCVKVQASAHKSEGAGTSSPT